jgi:hypothetical protein
MSRRRCQPRARAAESRVPEICAGSGENLHQRAKQLTLFDHVLKARNCNLQFLQGQFCHSLNESRSAQFRAGHAPILPNLYAYKGETSVAADLSGITTSYRVKTYMVESLLMDRTIVGIAAMQPYSTPPDTTEYNPMATDTALSKKVDQSHRCASARWSGPAHWVSVPVRR